MRKLGTAVVVAATLLIGTVASGAAAASVGSGAASGSFDFTCDVPGTNFTVGPITLAGTLVVDGRTRDVVLTTSAFPGTNGFCGQSHYPQTSPFERWGTIGSGSIAGNEVGGGSVTGACSGGSFLASDYPPLPGPGSVAISLSCSIGDGAAAPEPHTLAIQGTTAGAVGPAQFAGTYSG